MGKLVLRLPDGGTREIPLERERITIGRRPDNDVCLPYPAVSGEHAAVVTILDDSFLEDLNSTNGTLVNGRSITKHFLRDHDEIDVGRQVLVYYSGDFVGAPSGSEATDASEPASAAEARRGRRDTNRGEEGTLPLQPMVEPGGPGGSVDTATWYTAPHVRTGAAVTASAVAAEPARADAPTLEVLDGPNAGRQFVVDGDAFVLGRVGEQVAAVQRTPDGFRLVHVEGETRPSINGAALPDEGSLLAFGDEIEVAGTRLVWRPVL